MAGGLIYRWTDALRTQLATLCKTQLTLAEIAQRMDRDSRDTLCTLKHASTEVRRLGLRPRRSYPTHLANKPKPYTPPPPAAPKIRRYGAGEPTLPPLPSLQEPMPKVF